jgi:SAM-dependent methyltransferase
MNRAAQADLSQRLAQKIVKPIHSSTVSKRRIRQLSSHLTQLLLNQQILVGLDVGSGSGELAHNLEVNYPNLKMFGVDVLLREDTAIEVVKFDGERLPFADKSYDFVILIDVLHHTQEPLELLQECVRVSRQFILIKDHICESCWDRVRLSFMDWVGNRAYDVQLPYNYLSENQWMTLYGQTGLVCERKINKLRLYPQPFSLIFDSYLHFLAKLRIV